MRLKSIHQKSSQDILVENMIHHRVIFEMQGNSSIALSAETLCPLLSLSEHEILGT